MRPKSFAPWLVALACFGPFLLAWALYYGPWGATWLPRLPGSRELLDPAVAVPSSWYAEGEPGSYRWALIYARMTPCERECEQHLTRLLQVHLALGRDQDRTQRMLWIAGQRPGFEDPELAVHSLDELEGRDVAAALGVGAFEGGRVYVADPQGNVILAYPPEVEQKELLRDLKRLLSASGTD